MVGLLACLYIQGEHRIEAESLTFIDRGVARSAKLFCIHSNDQGWLGWDFQDLGIYRRARVPFFKNAGNDGPTPISHQLE